MYHHLVRFEVHRAHNYDAIHQALARRGIVRTITAGDGTTYQLDTGTYYYFGKVPALTVLGLAKEAARECGDSNASIVVAAADNIAWEGLQPVSIRKGA